MNWEIGECVIMTIKETGEWAKGIIRGNTASRGMRKITVEWYHAPGLYTYHVDSNSPIREHAEFVVSYNKFVRISGTEVSLLNCYAPESTEP